MDGKHIGKNPGDAGSSIKIEFDNKQNILDHRILLSFSKLLFRSWSKNNWL